MSEAVVRKRGDTYAIPLTITNDVGVVQDINGKAFVMTVNSVERPADASTELFQLVGVVTDAENGEVEFPMTDEQANHVGEFYYDVEMTDDGPYIWRPDTAPADGELFPLDGSDYLRPEHNDVGDTSIYSTIDGRRVVTNGVQTTYETYAHKYLITPHVKQYLREGESCETTIYVGAANAQVFCGTPFYASLFFLKLDLRGTPDLQIYANMHNSEGLTAFPTTPPAWNVSGWTAGWYVIGHKRLAGEVIQSKLHPEDSPTPYQTYEYATPLIYEPRLTIGIAMAPDTISDLIGISEMKWSME